MSEQNTDAKRLTYTKWNCKISCAINIVNEYKHISEKIIVIP